MVWLVMDFHTIIMTGIGGGGGGTKWREQKAHDKWNEMLFDWMNILNITIPRKIFPDADIDSQAVVPMVVCSRWPNLFTTICIIP